MPSSLQAVSAGIPGTARLALRSRLVVALMIDQLLSNDEQLGTWESGRLAQTSACKFRVSGENAWAEGYKDFRVVASWRLGNAFLSNRCRIWNSYCFEAQL